MDIDLESILRKRILLLLHVAGIEANDDDDLIEKYETALGVSNHGYRIIHKRDVDEIYVNNYNPEWIVSWNANMDL